MAHFIETSIGLVNLDLIARIQRRDRIRDNDVLHTVSGGRLECDIEGDYSLEGGGVIAAAPGTFAIMILVTSLYSAKRPEIEDIKTHREPIIGWRDRNDHLTPIFLERRLTSWMSVLQVGDKYHELPPDGAIFDSFEAACQHALADAQENWDRRNAGADQKKVKAK